MADNALYYGDNLDVLRRHVKDETVDLIYLDPPFNSKATYNVLFGEQNGSKAAAQIKAFEDTWRWDQAAAEAYQEVVEAGGKVSQAMQAFRMFLGDNDMLAYLAMMAPRLVELRRVLKPTGSIYLHCDPTASHYLKMLMDAIFEPRNFMSEVVWFYRRWTAKANNYQHSHDTILFFAKDCAKVRCHPPEIPSRSAEAGRTGRGWNSNTYVGPDGQRRRQLLITDRALYEQAVLEGRVDPADWDNIVDMAHRKTVAAPDVFEIPIINPMAKERLGYPTQKPEALLERIIKASSNEGDLVLDPFCGCGTTVAVAQRLKRRWIGIDITHLAIGLMRHRLRDAFGDQAVYQVIGEPVSLPDARTLAEQDPYQFQWWGLGLVGARPIEQKKGADKGIDGRLYFHDEAKGGKTKQVILSVKAGHTSVAHVRDLRGVMEREQAEIGVLLTMQEPTKPMRTEAAGAGFYHSPGWNKDYPKLQILTVEELLAGRGIDMPPLRQVSTTFKKAPRAKGDEAQTIALPLEQ